MPSYPGLNDQIDKLKKELDDEKKKNDGVSVAFKPMFSYGQRSKCADLLNSYKLSNYTNFYCFHFRRG